MQSASLKLTEDDCQEILSNYYNNGRKYQVNNVAVQPMSNTVGFLGQHYILRLTISNAAGSTDLSFFLKSLKQDNAIINHFVESGNMFNKEVGCYKFFEKLRTVNPTIDLDFCAKYYYSIRNEIIVLENLSDSGYEVIDFARLDIEHMKVALEAIAKFHASSLIFEELLTKDFKRSYSLIEDYAEYLHEGLYKDDESYAGYKYVHSGVQAILALIDQLPCKLPRNDFKQKVLQLTAQAYEDIKPSNLYRNVWSHGDLWVKNVMFLYKDRVPVHCKIFDFQFVRYVPPAHDVLEFIYDSADKNVFHNQFDILLAHYFECLENEFKRVGLSVETILSFDEFKRSVTKLLPVVKLIKTIHKSLTTTRHSEIFFGDPSREVIRAFKTQEPYRVRMTLLIQELENVV